MELAVTVDYMKLLGKINWDANQTIAVNGNDLLSQENARTVLIMRELKESFVDLTSVAHLRLLPLVVSVRNVPIILGL